MCKLASNLPICMWLGSQMFAWCHGVPMEARQQPACHMHMMILFPICMRSEGSDLPAFSAKTTISVLLLPVNVLFAELQVSSWHVCFCHHGNRRSTQSHSPLWVGVVLWQMPAHCFLHGELRRERGREKRVKTRMNTSSLH